MFPALVAGRGRRRRSARRRPRRAGPVRGAPGGRGARGGGQRARAGLVAARPRPRRARRRDGRVARADARPRGRRLRARDRQRGAGGGGVAAPHPRAALRAAVRAHRGRARARAVHRLPRPHAGPQPARRPASRRRSAGASGSWRWTPRRWRSARSPRACPSTCRSCPRAVVPRFEDDGPLGAGLLHDVLGRLAAALGDVPPFNLWMRTAPTRRRARSAGGSTCCPAWRIPPGWRWAPGCSSACWRPSAPPSCCATPLPSDPARGRRSRWPRPPASASSTGWASRADAIARRVVWLMLWVLGPPVVFLQHRRAGGDRRGGRGDRLRLRRAGGDASAPPTRSAPGCCGCRASGVGALMVVAGFANTGYLGLPFSAALFGARRAAQRRGLRRGGDHARRSSRSGSSIGAAFGTVGERAARARGRLLRPQPAAVGVRAGFLAPAALAPDWAVDASQVVVFALLPLGFFVVGVTLALEAEDGAVRFPPPLTAAVATALVLRLVVAPAVVLALSAHRARGARPLPVPGGDGERDQRRSWWRTQYGLDRGAGGRRDRLVDGDRGGARDWPSRCCRFPARCRRPPAPCRCSPPSRRRSRCPTGAGARRSAEHFLEAAGEIETEEELGDPGEIRWFPDRTWGGRTYVPGTAPTSEGYELFGYVSYTREHEGAQAADFKAAVDYTDETAEANPDWTLDLSDQEIGHWRGPEGRRGVDHARLGRGAGERRRGGHRRAGADHHRPVRARGRPLHADLARRLHRRLRGGAAVRPARRGAGDASRCTRRSRARLARTGSAGCVGDTPVAAKVDH